MEECGEAERDHGAKCRMEAGHWDADRSEHRSHRCDVGQIHVHVWRGPYRFSDLALSPVPIIHYLGAT